MNESAPPSLLPLAIGDVIDDRYVVETFIGEGEVSAVFGARSVMTDQRYALKCLKREASANRKIVERFAREARAALTIRSAYVVAVHDVGTLASGPPFLVMEYLEGTDLDTWRRARGTLSARQVAELALQMCEALAAAHARGVVHRDIQPKNLFVAERDGVLEIKVLDIGISKAALTGSALVPNLPVVKTVNLAGTPLYLSPEQLRSTAEVDGRSDIWSIGMVLYELLAGKHAFAAATVTASCAAILQGQPSPLAQARPDIPGGLVKVIECCLHKDPAQRLQNVAELAAALTRYAPSRARASAERAAEALRAVGSVDESALSLATVFSSAPPPVVTSSAPPVVAPPARRERVASTLVGPLVASPVLARDTTGNATTASEVPATPRPTASEVPVPPRPTSSELPVPPRQPSSEVPATPRPTSSERMPSSSPDVSAPASASSAPSSAPPPAPASLAPAAPEGDDAPVVARLLAMRVGRIPAVVFVPLALGAVVALGFLARGSSQPKAEPARITQAPVPPASAAQPVAAVAAPAGPRTDDLPPAETSSVDAQAAAQPELAASATAPVAPASHPAPWSPSVRAHTAPPVAAPAPTAAASVAPPVRRDPVSTPTPEPPVPTGRTFRRTM
ncbi:MAG TPA: protein kinase [Labilithrix sp.]|nr:protein kinase [Labilithrix sp.]